MQLSRNFSLQELIKSDTAIRKGIDNNPNSDQIEKLKLLCENILQPVRDHFGRVKITSGYRSPELCQAIGSSVNSQHAKAEAADFECVGVDNAELADWINRGERKSYNFMSEGEFRPLKISPSVQEIFEINAENLGVRNPFEQAEDIIDNIIDILEYVPLTSDYFPDLLNPFKNLPEPTLGPVGQLPPVVSGATPSVVNANAKFGSIPTIAGQTDPEEFNKVFPNG